MSICSVISLLPAPVAAITLYLLLRYKYPDGKFSLFYKAYILGMAGIAAVYGMDRFVSSLHLDSLHSLNRTLFYAFVLTGSVFELWKFIVLKLLVYPSKQVVKTSDVIVYSLVIAAGFTTSYSVYALYFAPAYINTCLYAFTIGPVFISIALIMGYFCGIAISRPFPLVDLVTGLFIAVLFQGIYRFCLLTSDTLLMYLAIAGMLITGITLLVISLREGTDSN